MRDGYKMELYTDPRIPADLRGMIYDACRHLVECQLRWCVTGLPADYESMVDWQNTLYARIRNASYLLKGE